MLPDSPSLTKTRTTNSSYYIYEENKKRAKELAGKKGASVSALLNELIEEVYFREEKAARRKQIFQNYTQLLSQEPYKREEIQELEEYAKRI